MLLTSIKLENFRSYESAQFDFSPAVTLIVGKNAAGKTNLLEAISMLATGKSFRAGHDREAIRFNEELARITGVTLEDKLEFVLTTGLVDGSPLPLKRLLVNGVPRRLVDFAGKLRVVLFWPEHLELVTDSPSLRRRYLDMVLVQVDREYYRNLLSYERGLRQRNRLLDLINVGSASRSQLLFWDQLLVKAGGYITDKREEYIDFVNRTQIINDSSRLASPVGGLRSNYNIIYDKSIISENRLAQYEKEEVAAKATLVGPHRDDFIITKHSVSRIREGSFASAQDDNNIELSKYGSRGEQRLAILWLKLAELEFIKEKTGDRPVLLLDDIFSELDEEHRKLVVDLIAKQQTIMTSAESDIIDKLGLGDVKVYKLS